MAQKSRKKSKKLNKKYLILFLLYPFAPHQPVTIPAPPVPVVIQLSIPAKAYPNQHPRGVLPAGEESVPESLRTPDFDYSLQSEVVVIYPG